jgi:hypothetical protein
MSASASLRVRVEKDEKGECPAVRKLIYLSAVKREIHSSAMMRFAAKQDLPREVKIVGRSDHYVIFTATGFNVFFGWERGCGWRGLGRVDRPGVWSGCKGSCLRASHSIATLPLLPCTFRPDATSSGIPDKISSRQK